MRARSLALLGVVLFATLVVVLHVADYTRVSPSDELQHYDYMVRVVRDHEIVRRGDPFVQESLRTEACQGLDAEFRPPPCRDGRYDPATFQEGGFNTAYIHQPVYYAISGFAAAGMSEVVGSDSLFTTGRLTGALWMAAALVLMWLAMGELGAAWQARAVALLLVATAPAVMEATATVNPDATALFAGASVLYAVLRWERGGRWWPAALAATAAVALKSTNVLALGLGIAYIAIRHIQRGRADGWGLHDRTAVRRALIVVGAMIAGAGVVAVAWVGYSSAVARVPTDTIPMARRLHADSIGLNEVVRNLMTGVTPLNAPYVPAELATAWISPVALLVDRLFLVGLAAAALLGAVGSRQRGLALATFVALVAVGPVFVIANFVLQGTYVEIPARYGLSLVPALAVGLTALLADRRVLAVAAVFTAFVSLATLRAFSG